MLDDLWRKVQEDKREYYSALMALFPLARTAGDKRSASAMRSYSRKVENMLKQIAPWVTGGGTKPRRKRKKVSPTDVKSGEVVVILDEHDRRDNPLYAGAQIRQR